MMRGGYENCVAAEVINAGGVQMIQLPSDHHFDVGTVYITRTDEGLVVTAEAPSKRRAWREVLAEVSLHPEFVLEREYNVPMEARDLFCAGGICPTPTS